MNEVDKYVNYLGFSKRYNYINTVPWFRHLATIEISHRKGLFTKVKSYKTAVGVYGTSNSDEFSQVNLGICYLDYHVPSYHFNDGYYDGNHPFLNKNSLLTLIGDSIIFSVKGKQNYDGVLGRCDVFLEYTHGLDMTFILLKPLQEAIAKIYKLKMSPMAFDVTFEDPFRNYR